MADTDGLGVGRPGGGGLGGGVLLLPGFRNLWIAQAESTVGDQIFPIAATVAVLDAGGSAGSLGLVLGARELVIVAFALIGGVWADRVPRRLVMMPADVFRAVVIAVIAFWPGGPPLPLIAAAVFFVGAGEAFFRPAETAMIATLVPRNMLAQANGMISVSYRTAAILGPGLGGLLVAGLHSPSAAFALHSLAFLLSMAFLPRLREPRREPPPAAEAGAFIREAREGLAEVRRQR
ncbi:MAG: MFS transporter [Candidatus Nanopelagicales bacterium]